MLLKNLDRGIGSEQSEDLEASLNWLQTTSRHLTSPDRSPSDQSLEHAASLSGCYIDQSQVWLYPNASQIPEGGASLRAAPATGPIQSSLNCSAKYNRLGDGPALYLNISGE